MVFVRGRLRMIKEGIKKVKGEEVISRQMVMTLTMAVKNCVSMKISFLPNKLGVQKKSDSAQSNEKITLLVLREMGKKSI